MVSQKHEKKSQFKQKTNQPKIFFNKNQNFQLSTVKPPLIYRKSSYSALYLEKWEMTFKQRSYFEKHGSSDDEEFSFVPRRDPKRNSVTNAAA